MGLTYRKRVSLGRGARANVSGSGVSLTKRVGPVSINSRGRLFVRLAKGLYYRSR